MQIQQSIQNSLGVVSQVPPQVLTGLVVGQQIEAAVVKAALAAQIASLRIGETLIDVRTPIPLQQGQTVQLELTQSGDKPVLKLIPPADVKPVAPRATTTQPAALVAGQQVAVEVIKLLNDNRLLVGTALQASSSAVVANRPLQFDIDIAALAKTFSVGEKVLVEIATVKPLTVVLKADPAVREQQVVERIKQLLPQIDTKPSLATINHALKTLSLPNAIQGEVNRLVHHVLDKQQVNQPRALQQAIQSSGVFTEKTLLKQPYSIGADFKANLLKLASQVEATLDNKAIPSTRISALPSSDVASKVLSPLQTLASTSLGKSQTTEGNPTISSQNQASPVKASIEQGQASQLRSPFAFQTASTVRAETAKGHVNTDNSRIQQQPQRLSTSSPSLDSAAPKLTLLTTILQALGAYNATPSSVSVLNTSPLSGGLSRPAPPFLESILTSSQASALAQTLNKTIATEAIRVGGQLDVLVLQGLLKEVESLHARIQLNQFSMIKESDSPTAPIASWLIDLPLKDKQTIEFLQLQIDQFKEQNDAGEDDIWSVQLRLDTQNLGPMQATVTMHNDDIKIVMRAERAESAVLLEQNLSWLNDALARLNVSVSHISCGCGKVAKPSLAEQYLAETTNLVDVSV